MYRNFTHGIKVMRSKVYVYRPPNGFETAAFYLKWFQYFVRTWKISPPVSMIFPGSEFGTLLHSFMHRHCIKVSAFMESYDSYDNYSPTGITQGVPKKVITQRNSHNFKIMCRCTFRYSEDGNSLAPCDNLWTTIYLMKFRGSGTACLSSLSVGRSLSLSRGVSALILHLLF